MAVRTIAEMVRFGHLELHGSKGRTGYIQGDVDVEAFLDSIPKQKAEAVREGYAVGVLLDEAHFGGEA